jgi:hypothetical protein
MSLKDKCPIDGTIFEQAAQYWSHLKDCHPKQICCCPHPDCDFATLDEDIMTRQCVLQASFIYVLLTPASDLRAHK